MQLTSLSRFAGVSAALFLTLQSACALGAQWQSKHFADHPLVGKIWSTTAQKFVSRSQLEKTVADARFVLLGETHSNRDHHQLQAQFVDLFARSSATPPRLVVEMIPEGLIGKLTEYRRKNPNDTANLGAILGWKKRGWGDWSAYKPIFDIAYKHKLAIAAGNLDRSLTRAMARKGVDVLDAQRQRQLSLNVDYSKANRATMLDLMFKSHCKLMPRQHLAPMLKIQQARDGKMANALLAGGASQKAVLIAGSGHIRNDVAVPRLLKRLTSNGKTVSIAFREVTQGHNLPQKYEVKGADNRPVFDYLYFTPVGEIKDHCAELAKRFGKTGKKKKPHGKSDSK